MSAVHVLRATDLEHDRKKSAILSSTSHFLEKRTLGL